MGQITVFMPELDLNQALNEPLTMNYLGSHVIKFSHTHTHKQKNKRIPATTSCPRHRQGHKASTKMCQFQSFHNGISLFSGIPFFRFFLHHKRQLHFSGKASMPFERIFFINANCSQNHFGFEIENLM